MLSAMLDIETLGTRPGSIIRSIGACTFDAAGTVLSTFYKNITQESCVAAGLTSDQATVDWWEVQGLDAREALLVDQVPLRDALLAFSSWYLRASPDGLWVQGSTFDPVLLEAAYRAVGLRAPWPFWGIYDTRTVYHVAEFNARAVERLSVQHNALEDCQHQVACLTRALTKLKQDARAREERR